MFTYPIKENPMAIRLENIRILDHNKNGQFDPGIDEIKDFYGDTIHFDHEEAQRVFKKLGVLEPQTFNLNKAEKFFAQRRAASRAILSGQPEKLALLHQGLRTLTKDLPLSFDESEAHHQMEVALKNGLALALENCSNQTLWPSHSYTFPGPKHTNALAPLEIWPEDKLNKVKTLSSRLQKKFGVDCSADVKAVEEKLTASFPLKLRDDLIGLLLRIEKDLATHEEINIFFINRRFWADQLGLRIDPRLEGPFHILLAGKNNPEKLLATRIKINALLGRVEAVQSDISEMIKNNPNQVIDNSNFYQEMNLLAYQKAYESALASAKAKFLERDPYDLGKNNYWGAFQRLKLPLAEETENLLAEAKKWSQRAEELGGKKLYDEKQASEIMLRAYRKEVEANLKAAQDIAKTSVQKKVPHHNKYVLFGRYSPLDPTQLQIHLSRARYYSNLAGDAFDDVAAKELVNKAFQVSLAEQFIWAQDAANYGEKEICEEYLDMAAIRSEEMGVPFDQGRAHAIKNSIAATKLPREKSIQDSYAP